MSKKSTLNSVGFSSFDILYTNEVITILDSMGLGIPLTNILRVRVLEFCQAHCITQHKFLDMSILVSRIYFEIEQILNIAISQGIVRPEDTMLDNFRKSCTISTYTTDTKEEFKELSDKKQLTVLIELNTFTDKYVLIPKLHNIN